MMKKVFLYFLTSCVLLAPLGIGNSKVRAESNDDYRFYKKHGHSKKKWNDFVKKGFAAYDTQDCKSASQFLKEAISLQAQDALVYFKLAVCTELLGSPYTAMQYYELAQEKLQNLKAVHRYQKDIFENYGRALFKAKRYPEALPYLNRATAVGNPSFGLFYMVGALYAKNKDWTAAVHHFQKALSQDTTGVDPKLLSQVYYQVGKAHYEKKDYKQASSLLEKAVELDANNQAALKLRSQVNTALRQQSIVEMVERLSGATQGKKEEPPKSQPPPPAASQLPPLDSGIPDPTPPLN